MKYKTDFEVSGVENGYLEGLTLGMMKGIALGKLESHRKNILDILDARFKIFPLSFALPIDKIEGISL